MARYRIYQIDLFAQLDIQNKPIYLNDFEILRPKKRGCGGIVYGAKKHKRDPPVLDIIKGLKQDQVSILHFPLTSMYMSLPSTMYNTSLGWQSPWHPM